METVLECTNEKITEMAANYGNKSLLSTTFDHLDKIELEAFLGLVYLAGVFKSNHEDVSGLFATDGTGRDIFRAVMSKQRFLFLLNALRFDRIESRAERQINDPLAAISNIFDKFIENSKLNYSCGQYVTIDEMLVPFRGKSKFRVYMKSKPAKYGLKIFVLADARTSYCLNASVYCGRQVPNPRSLLKPTLEVLNLVEPIVNTNRNVTADNYFSSVELVSELQKKGITYVGTMRRNKLEIPESFLPKKSRPVLSSEFAFTSDKTLVSYVPKYNKSVVLLSSMHHEKSILEDHHAKIPEIIDFYNTTKVGVDVLDQKCAQFSVGRRTRRWPMAIWFALMDIAGVNARILYQSVAPDYCKERRLFLVALGRSLIHNQLARRSQMTNIPRELKILVKRVAGNGNEIPQTCGRQQLENEADQQPQAPKRQRCHLCPRAGDKKHPTKCSQCGKGVCKVHSKQEIVCESCAY